METVGSIQVVATINTKDYDAGKKHIEKGNNDLEDNAKKTSSGFSAAWAGAIGGAVASLTSKLMGAVSSLTGEMTDMYDASIKFPKVIQSMGGSSEFASTSFNSLRKYADDTIYSLEDMTKTFGTLYAVSGDKAQPLVTALGGVSSLASNSTQAMDSWSLQLTQMVSKPSVAWQDFRILLEQNPAAIAKIAESMGKTSSQIVQDVQNGTLSTESFLTALQNVGNDSSLQKMATDSDNFKNATGQLKASVVSAGQKILEKFGPTMVSILNNAASAVDGISSSFMGVIDWFNKGGPAVDIVKSLAVAIGTVVTIMTIWNAATTIATAAQTVFNAVMAANPIGLIILAIAALVAGLIWFFTQTETGKQIWEGFTKFLGEAITNIGNWFKGLWDGIVATFQGVGKWFSDVFNGAWNGIKNAFSGVIRFFKEIWDGIVSIFGEVGTAVGDAIGGAFKNVINTVLKGAIGIINGFIGSINLAIDLINKIPGVNIGKLGVLPVPQFANGGFTGRGGKYEPAGIVHKGEYVVPKQYVNQTTGLPNISGGTEYNIQNINISSEVDGDRWLRRLTNNTEIESSGLVPTQRYA